MRRSFFFCLLILLSAFAVPVYGDSTIRDIDIVVDLYYDGSARITERWDVSATSGTEWYLVKGNLGDIVISNLSVTDETGRKFINEGKWDIDRSISEKAGRCGIVSKGKDYNEICWGIGSYGDHVFTVTYSMSNFVKSMNDYDAFNFQFISDELSANPRHAKVTIRYDEEFNYESTKIAGFGFYGDINIVDGDIVAESSQSFTRESSVIVLARFNKGIFEPTSVIKKDFSSMEKKALKGSDYKYDNGIDFGLILFFIAMFFMFVLPVTLAIITNSKWYRQKKVLGAKPKDINWSRDIPFKGDLYSTYYTLKESGNLKPQNTIIAALILRWFQKGIISIQEVSTRSKNKKSVITFNDEKATQIEDSVARKLYDIMKTASGADVILQNSEFRSWAEAHYDEVFDWLEQVETEGKKRLGDMGAIDKGGRFGGKIVYTEYGKGMAREMIGFKKYLMDFSLINERQAVYVDLWDDYLVFAALFGIADQVAKDLKGLYPSYFTKFEENGANLGNMVIISDNMSSNFYRGAHTGRTEAMSSHSSSWGGGGSTSFGGGGGFSGGGSGGGSR